MEFYEQDLKFDAMRDRANSHPRERAPVSCPQPYRRFARQKFTSENELECFNAGYCTMSYGESKWNDTREWSHRFVQVSYWNSCEKF